MVWFSAQRWQRLLLKSWPSAPQSWQYLIVPVPLQAAHTGAPSIHAAGRRQRRQRRHACRRFCAARQQARHCGPRSVSAAICPRFSQCAHRAVGSGTQRGHVGLTCRAQ